MNGGQPFTTVTDLQIRDPVSPNCPNVCVIFLLEMSIAGLAGQ